MSELAVIFYKAVKHNSHCVICKGPGVQWHHVRPADKINEVCKVAKHGDLTATVQELDKCIPLCQVHHSAVHKGIIPGYLDGRHDNGLPSFSWAAQPYMPYTRWFARRKQRVIREFVNDYIDRDRAAVAPLITMRLVK